MRLSSLLRFLWFDLALTWLRGSLLALNAILISYFLATQLGWPLPLCAWLMAAWGAWAVRREWKRSLRRRRTSLTPPHATSRPGCGRPRCS
jgi:hypothetical protein